MRFPVLVRDTDRVLSLNQGDPIRVSAMFSLLGSGIRMYSEAQVEFKRWNIV